MRKLIDENVSFFRGIEIIMGVEERLGVTIPDASVEAIRDWNDLTLNDIAAATSSVTGAPSISINEAIVAAVQQLFPDIPKPLDFNLPIFAIFPSSQRYGGY